MALEIISIGRNAINPQPGDLIFCHRKGAASATIRFFERIFGDGDYRWSHVAVVDITLTGQDHTVIEALTSSVQRNPLSEYQDIEYAIARTHLSIQDQSQAIIFLHSCLKQKYGWWSIVSIAIRYLTPGRGGFSFGSGSSTKICSALGAQTQVRGWAIYDYDPTTITPSELAAYHANH